MNSSETSVNNVGSDTVDAVLGATQRVYQLTFYKAGSQWVRDVLTDPRVLAETGFRLGAGGIDIPSEPWPELKAGEIAAPLYCAAPRDWEAYSTDSDRAIVILRDPRDIVVSLAASYRASHAPSQTTRLLRGPINSASPQHRLLLAMFAFSSWSDRLRPWSRTKLYRNAFVTTYCNLVDDQLGEFARIFDFLGWKIPAATLSAVLAENDFTARTGRARGDENVFNHRRKGQPGDWRNHFDIETGRVFEESFPRLLIDLGYEQSVDWWQALSGGNIQSTPEQLEHGQWLSVLEEFSRELEVVRTAAAERLEVIQALTKEVANKRIELEGYRFAAAERLRDVEELTATTKSAQLLAGSAATAAAERLTVIESLLARIQELEEGAAASLALSETLAANNQTLEAAAFERLHALESLHAERIALEQSWSYRLGFTPLRRFFGLFKDGRR